MTYKKYYNDRITADGKFIIKKHYGCDLYFIIDHEAGYGKYIHHPRDSRGLGRISFARLKDAKEWVERYYEGKERYELLEG